MPRNERVSDPILFLLVAALCSLPNSLFFGTAAAMSMPFETIEKGDSSGIDDALNGVYRTRQEFEAFWTRRYFSLYRCSRCRFRYANGISCVLG